MLIEEKYPHLKNPTKPEWHIVAVRSAIFVFACILISALAHLFGPKHRKPHINAPSTVRQDAASAERGGILYSPSTARSGQR